MARRLRLLHLEGDPRDVERIGAALDAEGVVADRVVVSTREAFEAALVVAPPDLVLSDFAVRDCDGFTALAAVRAVSADIPFVIVSGSVGEARAAAMLRAGATDFVLKDGLDRLGPAIRRALEEVRERGHRRDLEDQLRQAQKMEAVGQLTGGIAHDFNNLLTVMLTSAEMARRELRDEQAEVRADLDALLAAGERAKDLVRKLLGFSRRQALEVRPIAPAPLMDDVTDTLRRLLPAVIEIRCRVADDLPPILADPGAVEQMLLNLATNARDAMPDGGTLTIAVGLHVRGPEKAGVLGLQPGPCLRIAVSDTGTGMSDAVRERIFEPFYTTKSPGKGTGLGMAMVYGLARQQGGAVELESTEGSGTTVRVYLPLADAATVPGVAPVPAGRTRGGHDGPSATILVADDDPAVLRAVERTLRRLGYDVLAAGGGEAALQMLLAHRDTVRLVITDHMMPEFSGADLHRRAREAGLAVPFVVTSGYSAEELAALGFPGGVRRLAKPWALEELAAVVREALGA